MKGTVAYTATKWYYCHMEIHRGTDRLVISGRRHVAKIARVSSVSFLKHAKTIYSEQGLEGLSRRWERETPDSQSGLKWFLLHGVVANRREGRITKNYNTVLPTTSLLAGLINIQPTTDNLDLSALDICGTFSDSLAGSKFENSHIGHLLGDPSNFGLHKG